MKKAIFTLLMLLGTITVSLAQDISVGTASIAKVSRPVLIAIYKVPNKIVSEALASKLKKSSITKGAKAKGGFRAYKGVSIPEISADKIDVYTKVSGKKETSTLYFAVSKGYDNFITPQTDPEAMKKIETYVKSMMLNVNVAKLKTEIAAQAKVVKAADKLNSTKIKTGKNLESEKKNLTQKLADNKKNLADNVKDKAEAAKKLAAEEAKLNKIKATLEGLVK